LLVGMAMLAKGEEKGMAPVLVATFAFDLRNAKATAVRKHRRKKA
jgi:hypothetical protein